ncbi:MAG: AI-2E family transporter [Phycisphaerae bacterium]
MASDNERYTFDRIVRMLVSLAVLVALLALLRYLSNVLLPFAAAVLLAYLLNPLVTVFERKTKHRGLAVAITISGLGIVGFGLGAVMVPLIASQASRFQRDLTTLRDDLAASVEVKPPITQQAENKVDEADAQASPQQGKSALGWSELVHGWREFRLNAGTRSRSERLTALRGELEGTYLGTLIERALDYANSQEFAELLVGAARQIAVGSWTVVNFALSVVVGLTGFIIVLLYLVFLLLDFPEYTRHWKAFLPPQYRDAIVDFLAQFNNAMRRYFRGQAIVAIITGTLFAIGFTLMGLPMGVPFGLFIGVLNMVPYLQTVALVPAGILAALRAVEGDSSFAASIGLVLAVFIVVQAIQDLLVTPRVMGEATGLRPVAVLLGLFIWGKLLGFLGLVLAIPLTCLGIAYYRRYVLTGGAHEQSPPVG